MDNNYNTNGSNGDQDNGFNGGMNGTGGSGSTEYDTMGTQESSNSFAGNSFTNANGSDGQYQENCYNSYYQPSGGPSTPPEPPKKKPKKHMKLVVGASIMAFVLLFVGTVGGGLVVANVMMDRYGNQEDGESADNSESTDQSNTDVAIGNKAEPEDQIENVTSPTASPVSATDVSQVVENVMPSIVSINCMSNYTVNMYGQQFPQQSQGSGSGIIIGQNNKEVLIVTNNHVVKGESSDSYNYNFNNGFGFGTEQQSQTSEEVSLEVTFDDGTTAAATIKGTESGSDLAVIAVALEDLSAETKSNIKIATLGDSDSLKVGEMAIAIGNALGYGQSTTVGYISALNREVATEDYTMSLIQTDAAINPGNSGGALLNVNGEVIGINSVKYAQEDVEGMGFAIPISDAVPIINDLMNSETIEESEQAYLGIIGQDVTEEYTSAYGMPVGVYVYQVSADSPAEQAGVKMGNIITKFNSRTVESMSDLQRILATYRAGEKITITLQVFENGAYEEKTVSVTLGYKNQE